MKALQVTQPRTFTRVEVPPPGFDHTKPGMLLIHPEWVSMCGSDIPFFSGSKRHRSYPLPPGAPIHECTGVVVASTSDSYTSGERVVAIPEGDQGLAETFLARDVKAVKLPPELQNGGTACLIQPLSTVINAVDRLGDVQGKTVAVVGLGSIGLFFCWLLNKRRASRIIGVDPIESRCRIAEWMGATEVVAARSIELLHRIRQGAQQWEPPDICIEAVGHQMDTLNDCVGLVRQEGIILAFGVPDHPVYSLEYESFFRKNLCMVACVTPAWKDYLVISRDLFLSERTVLEKLVTHTFPIRDAAQAFNLYERHEDNIIKALIDMSAW